MDSNNKVIMMIGLPGSGKSSIAEMLAVEYNATIISSDKLREELLGDITNQTNNSLIFNAYYERAINLLKNHQNVILDSTNINRKDRSRIFNEIQQNKLENIEVIAYVVNTLYEECVERDKTRERSVGEDVIKKFLYRFEYPQKFEGFSSIRLNGLAVGPNSLKNILDKMDKFDQKNPHHSYTLGQHCRLMQDRSPNSTFKLASKFHDIGKLFTQTFDEHGVAHYYNHANVSAYWIISNALSWHFDGEGCDTNIDEMIFLVNYHMLPLMLKDEKSINKYGKLFGDQWFKDLIDFNKLDQSCCK